MRTFTALIVPAMTDQAGQCRIVARPGTSVRALQEYRARPGDWKEVGIMNSRGQLVCCEPLGDLPQQLKDCQPLSAGLVFMATVHEPTTA